MTGLLNYLQTKIKNVVKLGYVSRVGDDKGNIPLTQVTYLGNAADAAVIFPYGISASLPVNTQTLMFSVGANEESLVAIGYPLAERFKGLLEGEVIVGSPYTQSYVKFSQDGSISVESKKDITITGSNDINLTISGKATLNITGDVDLTTSGNVNVDATQVNLGTGGQPIARLGDAVTIGTSTGTITSAGTNTSI
jgi:hypothetical protein